MDMYVIVCFLSLTAFESTLHEMQCSDGQYISVLRTWNGEQFACLPELWRKYFPEVSPLLSQYYVYPVGLYPHMYMVFLYSNGSGES